MRIRKGIVPEGVVQCGRCSWSHKAVLDAYESLCVHWYQEHAPKVRIENGTEDYTGFAEIYVNNKLVVKIVDYEPDWSGPTSRTSRPSVLELARWWVEKSGYEEK